MSARDRLTKTSRSMWLPAAIVFGLAAFVVYALRELFAPGFAQLPGTDSHNLYSWEIYTRSVLDSGRLPHWNPYQFSGIPHLADTQMTVFYPPAMLLRWVPPLAFLPWMVAFHIWIAGTGTLFLARVLKLGWVASTGAAVAAMLGGSFTPWLHNGHLLLIYCSSWLPWALALSVLSVRRETVLPHPMLVIVLVLQFLAGFLQGSVYVTTAVCLYFVYSVVWPEETTDRWRPIYQLALLGVLAGGLSAFQLLPTAQLVQEAGRTAGLLYQDAARGGWTLADFSRFFAPDATVSDSSAYVGWLLAVFAPVAYLDRARRRASVYFGLLAIAGVVLAFGDNLPFYRLHHSLFPGFRIPGRALFVTAVCVAILGAIGLERALQYANRLSGRLMLTASAVAIIVIAVDIALYAGHAVKPISTVSAEALRRWLGSPDAGRALSLCENTVGGGAFFDNRQATLDGFGSMFLRDYAEWASLLPEGAAAMTRPDLLDLMNVTTIVACQPVEAPALTLVSQVGSIFRYQRQSAWPRAWWTCGAREVSRREFVEQIRDGRYDEHHRLVHRQFVNVRWAATVGEEQRRSLEERYQLADGEPREGTTWRYRLRDRSAANASALTQDPAVEDTHGIDRQTGEPSARAEEDPGSSELLIGADACAERGVSRVLVSDQPDGHVAVDVEASAPGMVFFAEPFYPERRAFVDGRAVTPLKVNFAFVSVAVPAGRHRVELRFVPRSFQIGAAVSLVTLSCWIGIPVAARRLGRRNSAR